MDTLVDSAAQRAPGSTSKRWASYGASAYLIGEQIAAGGMGTVHLGLKQGALGFRRLLAIKRLHIHLAQDPDFVARFKDEIRLVSCLNHPNLVQTFDVLETEGQLALVMEFVEGVTLHELLKDAVDARTELPIAVAVGIVAQALHGLHSAHEAIGADGRPLHLVHRDVSPQNIIIGRDGLVKVLDFGVAKATTATHVTRTGQLSGKAPYMAPEQVCGGGVDRRTDIFGAGVVLWEALTGRRLFRTPDGPELAALQNVLNKRVPPPSELRDGVSAGLERIVLRALEREPGRRFGSARDFALALEDAVPEASVSVVASGALEISASRLARSAALLARLRVGAPEPEATAAPLAAVTAVTSIEEAARWAPVATFSSNLVAPGPPQPPPLPASNPMAGDLLTADVEGISVEEPLFRRRSRVPLVMSALVVAAGVLFVWRALQGGSDGASVTAVASPAAADGQEAAAAASSTVEEAAEHVPSVGASRESTTTSAEIERASAIAAVPASELPLAVEDAPSLEAEKASATGVVQATRAHKPGAVPARKRRTQVVATRGSAREKTEPSPKQEPGAADTKCSPPTYIDAEGIRHFKPECL